MRQLLLRLGSYLNRKFNIIANDEDSLYYDWADQYLDGLTNLTFEEWKEQRNAVA